MRYIKLFAFLACIFLLDSCGAIFNQPFVQTAARTGEFTASTQSLLDLPPAQKPVEVAVYNFRDQTGQYKAIQNGSTFSTAVTQGGTTILLKALEDSGWFIPIERENLSNLSTERNIIRNTKQEYIKNLNPNEPPLPPLKYAGIILEGGIISYDTNIITGGIGARYFGLGGSAKYRQDRISVYLRMVSTSNGEILKTVYVSKTILSQALDANFFRYVKFQRLFEAETGITQNEPIQIAVKDAIEKGVRDLIIEGVESGYWSAQGGRQVNDKLVSDYNEEKAMDESKGLYDRFFIDREYNNSLSVSGGVNLIDGDYSTKKLGYYSRLDYKHQFNKYLGFNVAGSVFEVNNGQQFSATMASLDLNAHFSILPNDDFAPFLYGGFGSVFNMQKNEGDQDINSNFFKAQYGGGLEYFVSSHWGVKIFAEHNIVFSDELDGIANGKRDDFYFNFGFGVNYYFGSKKKNNIPVENIKE